ncbi:MAG: FliH/SctL family protein, partial [Geminicoccaceae bacterium]|nr:FliH/SctL family protein [Geminicoccaceae bacterium]
MLIDLQAEEPSLEEAVGSPEEPAGGGADADPPVGAPPVRVPRFTEDELEEAVAAAVAEAVGEAERGIRAEVTAAVEESVQARLAAALESCARELGGLHAATAARPAAEAEVKLALDIARAIVPHALERAPLADVEAMLVDLLCRLEAEPRLELRVAPGLLEPGRELALDLARRAGFPGDVVVDAAADLGPGDARVLWRHGRAERRVDRVA